MGGLWVHGGAGVCVCEGLVAQNTIPKPPLLRSRSL